MWKKSIIAAVLSVGLAVAGASSASAHECYVVDRSDKGNAGASNSPAWVTFDLDIAEFFGFVADYLGEEPLTPEQTETAVAMAIEAGIPTSITTFTRTTIPPTDAGPERGADGKGIDHLGDYFPLLAEIFYAAAAG